MPSTGSGGALHRHGDADRVPRRARPGGNPQPIPHRASEARTVTLDFGKPEGQELLRQLAAEADVLVENSRPGVMEKWASVRTSCS